MKIAGSLLLLLIAVSGWKVVRTRDVTAQILSLSFYGLLLAVMFFVFQAPDVALSQIVVGAVALPLMVMLAIARMQHHEKMKARRAKR
ncbi:MAG: Na(+)/H(+) antiporter subunit B [Terracidiphilus sp.]